MVDAEIDPGLQDWLKRKKQLQAEFREGVQQAKFSENVERYLSELVDDAFPRVKRYSTDKLAGIFSNNIVWRGGKPRQETDWFFSEENVNRHLGEPGIKGLSEKGIILGGYESLPAERRKLFYPRNNENVIDHGGTWAWLPYKEDMKELPDDVVKAHLKIGHEKLPENMDLFLGSAIFELYQSIIFRRENFPPEYGEILFS